MVKQTENFELINHKIEITNRTQIKITGVTNVESANDTEAVMNVGKTVLSICGENLKVNKIDVETGNVDLMGTIKSLRYSDTKKRTNFLKKLVK